MLFPQTRDCGCGCLRCLNAQTKSDMKRQLAGERLPTREIRRIPQGCGSPALYLWSAAGGCRTTNAKLAINGDSLFPKNDVHPPYSLPFSVFAFFLRSAKRQTEPAEKKTVRKRVDVKRNTLPLLVIQTKSAARSGISITVQQNLGGVFTLHAALFSYCYVLPDPYGALKHFRSRDMLPQDLPLLNCTN